MCIFSCELWKFSIFVFWSSRIFNFLLVTLGVLKNFVWSFHKGGNKVCAFFMWTLQVFYFRILKF
jgi:hypothetical protein